jgi:DNA-binding NtrC family response regulator
LVEYFNSIICNDYRLPPRTFTPEALAALQNNNWTGNIRELRNVIERLVILCSDKITEQDIESLVIPDK